MLLYIKNMAKRRYPKKRARAKRTRSAKKMARAGGKRRASIAMTRLIRSEIAREVENKDTQYYNLTKDLVSVPSATFQDNVIQVGPNNNATEPMTIYQGTGVASRIGNKIKTKMLMLKGTIVPLPYNATTNNNVTPLQVKMIVFYDRSTPNAEPQPSSNMFQQQGANAGFYNDLTDLWRPFNTDRYRILTTRTWKLGFAQNEGTGYVANFQGLTNNDFKMNVNFKVNLTKYYPKHVKFDENSGDPTTRGLWILFYYVSATGNAIGAGQAACNVQWMVDYKYEDA